MHLSRLTLSWEDGIHNVSIYSSYVVTCYLVSMLLLKCVATVDDLIIPALFSFMLDYSQIIPE